MSKNQGRPVNPKSERQLKPWEAFGVSRATFYWWKRYGDLLRVPIADVQYIERFLMRQPRREHAWLLLDFPTLTPAILDYVRRSVRAGVRR